jgi:hypothetical protein
MPLIQGGFPPLQDFLDHFNVAGQGDQCNDIQYNEAMAKCAERVNVRTGIGEVVCDNRVQQERQRLLPGIENNDP